VKPFHYFYNGKQFLFGSEIKQLLCFPFVARKINERAVYEYLAFSAVDYGEETFFSSINKLMQGHNLVFDFKKGTISKHCYYQPSLEKNTNISYREAGQEFRNLLTDSIRLQLRSDVEVGSCLSGGLDSSSIVSLMRDALVQTNQTQNQCTFSSHFEEEEANELEYMQEVIAATGVHANFVYPASDDILRELERVIWHQEEPFGSTSIFAQWSVFKLVNQNHIKVMLDGQGADEVLAGYVGLYPLYFDQLRAKRQYLSLFTETRNYARLHHERWLPLLAKGSWGVLGRFGRKTQRNGFTSSFDWLNPILSRTYQSQSLYQKTVQLTPFGEDEHLENKLYQMTFFNNLQTLLRHEDRNSMAFSVEARVPFLDHRLVEFVFSLPSKFKIRDGYTKRVLRDGMNGVIPEKIRWRVNKLGFATPEKKWQNTFLKPWIEAAIKDERINDYIVADKAAEYFNQLQQYSLVDFSPWRWLNLSLWIKCYDLG
jgi:asparagine synthase (glutamine-hydrolysing)